MMDDVVSGNVTHLVITMKEYLSLQEDSRWRQCVEDAGVDNWEQFHYAMEAFHENEDN